MRPVEGPWIVVDDAYAAQMAERARLMRDHRAVVLAQMPGAEEAMAELLGAVLGALAAGFRREGDRVTCPDGRTVWVAGPPFEVINGLLQEDILLLDRPEGAAEHVLIAGLLCFPAYWTLAEKIGRPLGRIHAPVPEYDAQIAGKVQRLFDRVPVGRTLWRANVLPHREAVLHRPKSETAPRVPRVPVRYIRSERQTVFRLPVTGVMVFAVHTWIVPVDALSPEQRATCPGL